jgi:SAM-dependent methyltransferase
MGGTEQPAFLWPEEASAVVLPAEPCPTCGNGDAKGLICLSVPGVDPAWRLLRCPACGCGFFENQATADYADAGMTGATTTYFLQQGAAVAIFADILAHIRKAPGATYVEIGCGFGFGLDIATHGMGWLSRGMDPAKLSEVGRDMLGVDIALAYFDPQTVADASCDIVMATEVLEHLPDPVAFLGDIRRGLKPDGIVVLTTPDVAAVRPPIAKSALNATLSIGLHLILHSRASLEGALRRAGFPHLRIESDGWKLTAFGAAVPLDLRDDAEERHAIVTRYLTGRAEARAEPDDLFIGFAGRAFFEAVSAGDGPAAARIWARLDPALRTRYHIDVDMIDTPVAGIASCTFDEIAAIMPFNLAVIMLARAYQRLHAGETRPRLLQRFAAIRTVCGPLWARLEARQIGDMQTRQILWVAAAEIVLCVAAQGLAAVIQRAAELPESPTGTGRSAIIRRAIEILLHGEHPYRAIRLAHAEQLPHKRAPGDSSMWAMITAFARESAYSLRRLIRAR